MPVWVRIFWLALLLFVSVLFGLAFYAAGAHGAVAAGVSIFLLAGGGIGAILVVGGTR